MPSQEVFHASHDSGLTAAPETAPVSWVHPQTGEHHDLLGLSLEERLRLLCDTSGMNEYERMIQDSLFPADMPVRPVNPEAFAHTELTELTREQRFVRREILERVYGFTSPRKMVETGQEDNPDLHVGFVKDQEALAVMLNGIDGVRRLAGIGQTDVRQREGRLTRADHSQHLARMVAQTNIRLALQQPSLYRQRLALDMQRYSEQLGRGDDPLVLVPSEATKTAVQEALEQSGITLDATELEALLEATEYGKYFVMAAYLHDVMTPGWGDVFMKTRPRGDATVGVRYSEDEALAAEITHLLRSEVEGLPAIVSRHEFNEQLLARMIHSMAKESDVCLGGFLMKDKRKFTPEQKQLYPHLDRGGVVDEDQDSGMLVNAAQMAKAHLPGGLRHSRRHDPLPLGAFEDRLRLLSYAMTHNIPASTIAEWCTGVGIAPESLFISAEEVTVGNNLRLEQVVFDDVPGTPSELLPIPTQAGDVKRMKMMMNVLTLRHFRSPSRETTEALVQTCIAYGKTAGVVNDDMCIRRTDKQVEQRFNDVAPVIPYVLETLQDQATILTEMDVARLAEEDGQLDNVLILEEKVHGIVYRKPGTLIRREDNTIVPAQRVLSVKRDMTRDAAQPASVDPRSLMGRLNDLDQRLNQARLFKVFQLTPDQVRELQQLLRQAPDSEAVMRQAFSLWTRPVQIDGRTLTSTLAPLFSPPGEPAEAEV